MIAERIENMVHVRFDGRSYDIQERELGLKTGLSEREIKRRIASHLDINVERLTDYVVDWVADGNLIIRPEAVYG